MNRQMRYSTNMLKKLKFNPLAVGLVFASTLIVSAFNAGVASAFTGSGAGTVGSPYLITNCMQLQEMQDDLDAHYRLANNIDCSATSGWNSGAGFEPVGSTATKFTGSLDGQGNIVTGLHINRGATGQQALFGHLGTTAEIQDIGLTNVSVTGATHTGGLAGDNDGVIENSYVTGTVQGTQAVGGLVGNNDKGSILDSYSDATVTGSGNGVGGLVGYMNDGTAAPTITHSYATGDVSGTGSVGGLLGEQQVGIITDSYATGDVEGDDYVGGLIGYTEYSTVSRTYATGDVSVTGDYAGGITGYISSGTLEDSYSIGNIIGGNYIGGITGYNDSGDIQRSYSIGTVTTSDTVFGGLIGANYGTITDSFWNTTTSGQADGCSTVDSADCNGVTGKTTAEMKALATFQTATWDIALTSTNLNNGYPFLSWQTGDSTPVWYILGAATDGDGISDAVEDAAPNGGDGNNDGTADSQQANVVSFVNAVTSKYVTLEVNSACTLTAASSAAESANTAADSGFDYPAGLVNFTASCGTPGFAATVTQYYYGANSSSFVLRKYNPATKAYSAISGAVLSQVTIGGQAATKAVYNVTDGGSLDTDGAANGTIVDPAGLALQVASLANTGQNTKLYSWLAVLLIVINAGTIVWRKKHSTVGL